MVTPIDPVVRHMLLCDRVVPDPANPRRIHVYGLASTLLAPDLPLRHAELCVYLGLTGGRGSGEARVVVVRADTEDPVFASQGHRIAFGPDPLAVVSRSFRLRDCVFPTAGLYWVEFRFNGRILARQPLEVRQHEI